MSGINRVFTSLAISIFAIAGIFHGDARGNITVQGDPPEPVYVVIMNHVEGDGTCRTGDTACLASTAYQTLPLPPPGIPSRPSYSLDITGNDLIYEILLDYTDTFGRTPKLFIEPTGEWWQTYSDPGYGGKAFNRYDYPALGNEFGIQGHAAYYSGYDFGWYQSPHTEQGISLKFRDLDYFADQAFYNGLKVNNGKTYTGGWKLESGALGDAYAEYVIDHEAYDLGYRISLEDHDGHIRNEPAGIDNSRPSYYVYRAAYDDGVRIVKIDMNGTVTGQCQGNTPRCERPDEAINRFDRTQRARILDPDRKKVYFFAFTVHSNGVWNDYNNAAAGYPLSGEGLGLNSIMDAIQAHVNEGAIVKFVTPMELAALFKASNRSYAESPFGFHPAGIFKPGYTGNAYDDAMNIGVRWNRPSLYAFWFLIQPDLDKPAYYWEKYDELYGDIPADINILANIAPQGQIDQGRYLPNSYLPIDAEQYMAFVRATVERYDGDGKEDMPGLANPVRHWQVGNEPNDRRQSDFAALQRMTYQAVKAACPACKVLIGGATGFPWNYIADFDRFYAPILADLNGDYVDIFDFHWYGTTDGEYRLKDTYNGRDVLNHIRTVLLANGFPPGLPIWITEMGSYSGDPVDMPFSLLPYQSEGRQAGDYLKRFIYPLSRGIDKVFPAFGLMEGFKQNNGYFDHTGLIYDGRLSDDMGFGVKKLSYYTYKLMTEKLEGSDWDNIQTIQEYDGIYVFRLLKNDRPVWVAWDDKGITCIDTPCRRQVTIPGIPSSQVKITEAVPNAVSGAYLDENDYPYFFETETRPVINGQAIITLGENPVFVETANGG